MAIEVEEFHKILFQDVHGTADSDGRYVEDAFFELFCNQLIESGELDTADRAPYAPLKGRLRVDGYGGDPASAGGVLSLIIADFSQSPELSTLTATEMDAIFKRLSNFLAKSLDASFRQGLEETDPAFGLSDLISSRWSNTSKVRLILISDRILSARVDGREAGEFDGVPVTYSVWDIGRLHRFAISGLEREEIEIDLQEGFGGAIPALPAHLDNAGYEAYLLVIPGSQLASIYDKWGARLLEQNVRVFLQARASVNKGIRNTIEADPAMFFAYNNGITATAESVETETRNGHLVVVRLKNFQIVNGGQTTASIHAASRKKDVDLSRVFVQMKLSIVERQKSMEIVPKISEFANSQNRVNAADFFANHPFHVRVEEFSRRVTAPSADGSFRESKWFYERARGQYQDAMAYLSPAQRRKFDLEFPKAQVFSKTDLAKYLNVWKGYPDVVSKGAQKNFAQFAHAVGQEWTKHSDEFSEVFYRQAIAKAIVFRDVEKLVTEQPWYQGGYRANVVAYAIAKLGHDVEKMGRGVNFESIWKAQAISPALSSAFAVVSEAVHTVIVDPPSGISNVTEWAKQQACWKRVSGLQVEWPEDFREELLSKEELLEKKVEGSKDQRMLNGIEAQTAVIGAGGAFWQEVVDWCKVRKMLSPTERGVLEAAASIPRKVPSEKQCLIAVEALRKLHADGCQIGLGQF